MNLQRPSLDPCQDVSAGGRSVIFNKLPRILYGISTYKQHLVTRQVTEPVFCFFHHCTVHSDTCRVHSPTNSYLL